MIWYKIHITWKINSRENYISIYIINFYQFLHKNVIPNWNGTFIVIYTVRARFCVPWSNICIKLRSSHFFSYCPLQSSIIVTISISQTLYKRYDFQLGTSFLYRHIKTRSRYRREMTQDRVYRKNLFRITRYMVEPITGQRCPQVCLIRL